PRPPVAPPLPPVAPGPATPPLPHAMKVIDRAAIPPATSKRFIILGRDSKAGRRSVQAGRAAVSVLAWPDDRGVVSLPEDKGAVERHARPRAVRRAGDPHGGDRVHQRR